ncbi:hypothetical protein GW17_00052488 [Ensete ventricosum]|nr:hypothetical protein GW17_00052488 [Ensete ventricosum]
MDSRSRKCSRKLSSLQGSSWCNEEPILFLVPLAVEQQTPADVAPGDVGLEGERGTGGAREWSAAPEGRVLLRNTTL